ncbi:MAG: peptide chain release factor 2 [Spartobacteria bacterium]|nr:peptide chain release factor 2 [Spartobacteria bacterium]
MFDIEDKCREVEDLERQTAEPGFWDDQAKAQSLIAQVNALKAVVVPFAEIEKHAEDAQVMLELAEMEDDEAQRNTAFHDVESILNSAHDSMRTLEMQSLLSGQLDMNNAYISLHAGAGGTESCDWADMLLRMYRRYAERHGFDTTIMEYQPGDEAGVKSVTLFVEGAYAYGHFKAERGVHRLVRISPFDSNKRRHTSFASLDVIAEIDESIDVVIEEKDIRIDTYRASGAGGQHINKTDSAIRITHGPTGIVVACQVERSQHMNRAKAMAMLKARLYEWELDQKKKEMERFYSAKGEIAWGSQIRSYVFQPYTMVKDLRTEYETGNVQAVMDGELDGFVEAYLKKNAGQDN